MSELSFFEQEDFDESKLTKALKESEELNSKKATFADDGALSLLGEEFKYEKEKKAHKQKLQQKKVDTKGIRLSVRISAHDFNFRVDQAVKFLKRGDKLKAELILKGREKQHPEKARETIDGFLAALEKDAELNLIREQDLTRQGGRYTITLINKKG